VLLIAQFSVVALPLLMWIIDNMSLVEIEAAGEDNIPLEEQKGDR